MQASNKLECILLNIVKIKFYQIGSPLKKYIKNHTKEQLN